MCEQPIRPCSVRLTSSCPVSTVERSRWPVVPVAAPLAMAVVSCTMMLRLFSSSCSVFTSADTRPDTPCTARSNTTGVGAPLPLLPPAGDPAVPSANAAQEPMDPAPSLVLEYTCGAKAVLGRQPDGVRVDSYALENGNGLDVSAAAYR